MIHLFFIVVVVIIQRIKQVTNNNRIFLYVSIMPQLHVCYTEMVCYSNVIEEILILI